MTYTILTLALVGLVLLFWLYHLMRNCFSRSFCILKSQKSGSTSTTEASIISVTTIKNHKKPLLELLVLFENFSGHYIQRKIRVWDSKPELGRFQMDKKIPLGLNIARKPKDPIYLSQQMCRFSFGFVILCSLKAVIYVIGCYVLVSESLGKIFLNQEHYEVVFKSSNTWQIGMLLFGLSFFLYLLLEKIGVLVNGKTMHQNWDILYYGIGATAKTMGYKKTGTKINNNLVVQFQYTFVDIAGDNIYGSDKKVIHENQSPEEIDHLQIMYLPYNPSVSRISENLETLEFNRFLNILFMIVSFIFSVVFIFSFYKTVFHS